MNSLYASDNVKALVHIIRVVKQRRRGANWFLPLAQLVNSGSPSMAWWTEQHSAAWGDVNMTVFMVCLRLYVPSLPKACVLYLMHPLLLSHWSPAAYHPPDKPHARHTHNAQHGEKKKSLRRRRSFDASVTDKIAGQCTVADLLLHIRKPESYKRADCKTTGTYVSAC